MSQVGKLRRMAPYTVRQAHAFLCHVHEQEPIVNLLYYLGNPCLLVKHPPFIKPSLLFVYFRILFNASFLWTSVAAEPCFPAKLTSQWKWSQLMPSWTAPFIQQEKSFGVLSAVLPMCTHAYLLDTNLSDADQRGLNRVFKFKIHLKRWSRPAFLNLFLHQHPFWSILSSQHPLPLANTWLL